VQDSGDHCVFVPCEAEQKPMAALSFGRSAPRPLTAQTKPLSGHVAPPGPPAKQAKGRNESKDKQLFKSYCLSLKICIKKKKNK